MTTTTANPVTRVPAAPSVETLRHFEQRTDFDTRTLFVVYCAGPHCNGVQKAARRLAQLDRPVKEMIGGIEGWKDKGFELVTS
jgi:rhodanese-related sulfurtransferase